MTYLVVHQCPKCELRFSFRTELERHLRVDHSAPVTVEWAAANVAEVPAASARLGATPAVVTARRVGARRRLPVVGLLLVLAAVPLMIYAAMFVSMSATVVIALAVLLLVGMYVRRSRGRPRVPRRREARSSVLRASEQRSITHS